ncbi:MAG: hypothetical protein JXA64_08605 [Candidatus Fermentibacteraceae bacterium]|nr:hypothetical protein [Candidatus Fermentibacteraceae bacterium]MBN2609161.1 hypothetical protein [Candidatus Fermentibacteraceae bacterium]
MKKKYVKPSVERVELVVRETVLTFCKTTGSGGPIGVTGCNQAVDPTCMQIGT